MKEIEAMRQAVEAEMLEAATAMVRFALENDRPKQPTQGEIPGNWPERQRMLLSGLDCLPDQLDLFDCDKVDNDEPVA